MRERSASKARSRTVIYSFVAGFLCHNRNEPSNSNLLRDADARRRLRRRRQVGFPPVVRSSVVAKR